MLSKQERINRLGLCSGPSVPARHGSFTSQSRAMRRPVAGRLVEADIAGKTFRVRKVPNSNVPDRQVAVIIGVDVALVMNAVRFRPLDDVAEPCGVRTFMCWK